MRLLLDTNVLIAALVADGLCRDLVRKRVRPHSLVSSQSLLDELHDKLRSKFRTDLRDVPFLAVYADLCELVIPKPLPAPMSRDKDDDVVLATAVAGEAAAIITGDADLLILQTYAGIRIMGPRQWIEWTDGMVREIAAN